MDGRGTLLWQQEFEETPRRKDTLPTIRNLPESQQQASALTPLLLTLADALEPDEDVYLIDQVTPGWAFTTKIGFGSMTRDLGLALMIVAVTSRRLIGVSKKALKDEFHIASMPYGCIESIGLTGYQVETWHKCAQADRSKMSFSYEWTFLEFKANKNSKNLATELVGAIKQRLGS